MTRTLATETIKLWRNNAKITAGETAEDDPEHIAAKAILALTAEILANREAQPVAWRHDNGPFAGMAITRAKSVADSWIAKGWTVTPLYTAPPAPAVNASPDFEAWFVEKYKQPERLVKNEDGTYKFAGVQMAFSAWVDGRAAMLAQPVSQGYTLPEGWIACSERMPEVGERDWRTALPVLVKCEIGVIPAYYGFTYHEGEQCFGFMESIKFGDASGSGPEQHENRLMMHVTHWMPLPAAPEGGNDHDTGR
ncbi:TPA: DUF551 domain-containing protein [Serratia marcescens]